MSQDLSNQLIKLGAEWAAAMVANDATQIGSFMADEWVIVSELPGSTDENNGVALPGNYVSDMRPVAEKRAALAGYRLANYLSRKY